MDYGKFKYEAGQKAKESRRKTTQISIKEMKYRVKIGKGDFDTKTRKVEEFLEEGHKVKITIMFRGREVAHPELGMKILDQVAAHNADLAKVEAAPKLDGRNMVMVLAPDKRVQAEAARRKALEAEDARAAAARAASSAGGGSDQPTQTASTSGAGTSTTSDGVGAPPGAPANGSADVAQHQPTGAVGEENP